jgi:hypothetical protein
MLIQPKNVSLVEANTFEDPVSVEQAMIEDRDLRICLVHEFAIEVNFHFRAD